MRKMRLLVLVVLLTAGLAFAAQMPQGLQTQKADSGTMVLADAKGMTLPTTRMSRASRTVTGCARIFGRR